MKKFLYASLAASSLIASIAYAVDKHPNLTAAHEALKDADAKITKAQAANEYDMGGHAAKAKELIGQAMTELKAAREAANENKK